MMGLENTEKAVAEDAGVGLKRELNSLLTRYPAELARTRDQIQKRADLSAATHLKIAAVQQAIAGLEPVVRAQHGQIQGEVRLMQGRDDRPDSADRVADRHLATDDWPGR